MITVKEAFRLVVEDALKTGLDEFHDALYLFVQKTPAQQMTILKNRLQIQVDALTVQRDAILPAADTRVANLQAEIDEMQAFIDA